MNRDDFKRTLVTLNQVERDLKRLVKNARKLAQGLGQDLGGVFDVAVQRRLEEAERLLAPLASILRLGPAASQTHRPRPKSKRGTPNRSSRATGRSRGGRGRKLNLSTEQIQDALARASGIKAKAAELLGVSIPTFNKYFREG